MLNSKPDLDPIELELDALLPSSQQKCPPIDVLIAAGMDVLPPEAESAVQRHLLHCKLCTLLLADLASLPEPSLSPAQHDRIAATLPGSASGSPSGPAYRRFLPLIVSIAAALLVAVVIGRTLTQRSHPTVQVVQSSPAAAPPAVIADLQIPLLPLPPPAPGATAPLTRGSHSGEDPFTEQLLPAFDAYNRNDYSLAAKRFFSLAATYPHSPVVHLYLGVSQLFLAEDQAAFTSLAIATVARTRSVAEPAAWYQAIAAQRLHHPNAKSRLESICHNSAAQFSPESCNALAHMP